MQRNTKSMIQIYYTHFCNMCFGKNPSRRIFPFSESSDEMKEPSEPQYLIRFGGYMGEKGRAAASMVLYKDTHAIRSEYTWVDVVDSPVEIHFYGLILGMERLSAMGVTHIKVEGSETAVIDYMEIGGETRSESIRQLYRRAKSLERQFESVEYDTITKETNHRAIWICKKVVYEAETNNMR